MLAFIDQFAIPHHFRLRMRHIRYFAGAADCAMEYLPDRAGVAAAGGPDPVDDGLLHDHGDRWGRLDDGAVD